MLIFTGIIAGLDTLTAIPQPFYSLFLTLLLFDDANVERFFLICKFLTKL